MRKYDFISALAKETAAEVVKNREEWMKYLTTAARLYKYPFREQLLIYAQRPDATACASIELWNERMHCWVNKGAKGIALLDEDDAHGKRLKYVFDVSDVHAARRIGRYPELWELHEEHKEDVIKRLEQTYGATDDKKLFEERLMEIAERIAADYYEELLPDLQYMIEGSFLEGLDEQNVGIRLRETLSDSISFTLLSACGADMQEYGSEFAFDFIHEFNSMDTLAVLGDAANELAKPVLLEIGRTIRAYNRSHEQEQTENLTQKGLANTSKIDYNALKRESESGHEEYIDNNQNSVERGNSNESDIREEWGLSDPDITGGQSAGGNRNEVRNDEGDLSEGEPQGRVLSVSSERDIERTPADHSEAGRGENGETDKPDGGNRGSDRTAQGNRSDALGSEDEQHSEPSRGSGSGRTGLQFVTDTDDLLRGEAPEPTFTQLSLFPSFEEQVGTVAAAEASMKYTMPAAFSLPQNELETILRSGGGKQHSRKRIFAKYTEGRNAEQMVDFLKNEYGQTGKGFEINGNPVSVWFDEHGMSVGYGTQARETPIVTMDWEGVESHIRSMIENGTYMSASEAFLVDTQERNRVANQIYFFLRDGMDEMPEELGLKAGNYPESEAKLMELLSTHEGREQLKNILEDAAERLASGEAELKWRHVKSLEYLLSEIADLDRERLEFPLPDAVEVAQEDFITQDEIDQFFLRDSVDRRLAVYSHFCYPHTPEEHQKFIKSQFGEYSGGGCAGYNHSKTHKGLEYVRDYGFKKYDTVHLTIPNVVKEYERLIAQKRFPGEDAIAKIPEYERRQVARAIYSSLYNAPDNVPRPYYMGMDYYQAVPLIEEELQDRSTAMWLMDALNARLGEMQKDDRHYEVVHETHFQLYAYVNGEFSLFNHRHDGQLTPTAPNEPTAALVREAATPSEETMPPPPEPVMPMEPEVPEPLSIGTRLTIDGRQFEVDSVDDHTQNVSLRDVTFEGGTGFPIFRTEPISFVRKIVEQADPATLAPPQPQTDEPPAVLTPPKKKKQNALAYPLDADGRNYRITDDHIGEGAPLERFQRNLDAIRTLKAVEAENRAATAGEQAVLAQYVGWGGLADFFDEKNPRCAELKELLTDAEYAAARESTLTAFYTPPVVIRGIYAALGQMGFTQGNILEPACGIGNFLGMLPESMSGSKLYGVELDDLSGRIARQLYQKSSIAVQGYEKTAFPDNFFDVAIGNVPFGQFHVADKRYDRLNFPIHEYFIAKALDQVRPGGVIAVVTSSYTMDKRTASARKYIAQRSELLGAIRLPNNAFKAAAGTEVVSDILFLQKRERMVDIEPEWVHLATNENGIQMNSYFIDHPDMVLGEMKMVSGPFGPTPTCEPYPEQPLEALLAEAVQNVHGEITAYDREEELEGEDHSVEADPAVRNFSYTLVDGHIYYRENSRMNPVEVSKTAESRIRGMIELRDCVRTLLEYQTEDYPDEEIKAQQAKLNTLYDAFTRKYGLINSRGNAIAFDQDSSYFLLCSLEILDEDRNLKRKADLFTKRTIRSHRPAEKVDTAVEALALSIGENAHVDMEYMSRLTGKDEETLFAELTGVVFLNPDYAEGVNEKYLPADEYLSGNVRQKLAVAQDKAEQDPQYQINAEALAQVQPTDLTASEISVRLGATWLDTAYVRQFIFEMLGTPRSAQWSMKVHYSGITGEWRIEGKSKDRGNVKAISTYGTQRINAYEIIETTLNLKDVRIFDYQYDEEGRRIAVLNKKETAIAQSKQELIKDAFAEWIWKDPDRREAICKTYNILFNSNRPREYDGSHISFSGMNPEITLRKHQVNAIAHILYGGNTLLAHVVGAGKTFGGDGVKAAGPVPEVPLCGAQPPDRAVGH